MYRQISIQVPRGCNCYGVAIGSHDVAVEVQTPPHMRALGRIGCYEFRDTLSIDICVLDLLQALWDRGVVTLGSCCGHNIMDGEIIVWQRQHDEWVARMKQHLARPADRRTQQ